MMFQTFSVHAGYKNTKLLFSTDFKDKKELASWSKFVETKWRRGQGRKGTGALHFKTNSPAQTNWVYINLPTEKFQGLIRLEVIIRGKNLIKGSKSHFGPKVMLSYKAEGKSFYPSAKTHYGTYKWEKVELISHIPSDYSELKLLLGIQKGKGEIWIDSVRIYRCIESNNSAQSKK